MIPVSVVIVTKDEERDIGNALESVKDFEDIVVVDSFSDDKTVEICREYTDRVFQQEWQGYARQKQSAVNHAKKPWVLILDADERLTPELKEEISQLFADHQSRFTRQDYYGFFIPRKNFFLGRWIKYGGWWPDYTIRLFRKDSAYVEEREVHEKVIVRGPVGYLTSPMEHYTYRSISEYIKKMDNYSTLAAREIISKEDQSKASLLFKMTIRPAFTFLRMFFLKQGLRDGIYGFILAALYSFYTFLKYLKAWEMRL